MNEMIRKHTGRGTLNDFDLFLQSMLEPFAGFAPEYMDDSGIYPRAKVKTYEDKVTVQMPLPGIKKEEIQIEMAGDQLTVHASRKPEPHEAGQNPRYLRRERTFGEFEETLRIHVPVVNSEAKAEYVDGILTITLPRMQESARSCTVKVG